jgi:hypothetical protein
VACLPSNDNCPVGQYCAGTSCAPGCRNNQDCTVVADAGSDAATDGGTGGGTVCDTTHHTCVGCLTDSNCSLGQTCTNNQCVGGCDPQHGCPAGSGCCSGTCLPLNTTSNCTACGVTCDTTSGNSQGAACSATGCTYTGCAAGWADCNSTAPDSDGCETNLTTSNQKVCADGACVANGTCCTAADCTTPPAPAACYPAEGTCAPAGTTCGYALNAGSVVCNGTTCCNAVNGTCNNDCSLDCNTGFAHCTANPSNGCETNTNTNTADCGACGRACSTTHTTTLSCSSGECNSACAPGWGNCSTPLPPAADDGCESNLTTCYGTPCCTAGQCADPHKNGAGQNYNDCNPLGTVGNAATYTQTMAQEAATAYGLSGAEIVGTSCGSEDVEVSYNGVTCASWCYAGACAGYFIITYNGNCYCPGTSSGNYTGTWD